ncbi:angiogenic factor with G patch and FHA domains 1 isoform X1 [Scaptodrosophila lebanonensis]|uniref:Angiogenic factor with G patch and FHA domains 1 isoform X1 n=1 Tax=Drosophila lebanonensis TaxID=7225 RepID=A0A6J2T2J1_DROLE|nr:angiogenic factor with G patch and FHA domains 1 isoform X1 [Scaptodrosophila lebanonensis]
MSEAETESPEFSDAPSHDYIELKSVEEVQALEKKQIVSYIEKLHGIIRKYDIRFAKYKQKLTHLLKEAKTHCDKSTQISGLEVEDERQDLQAEHPSATELSATDAFSFVDEMRQAAKHAENLNNFVYEPTSGMYYDPKTGYYYNAEYGLYYDGNTGCYYSYDQAKDSYEFHSKPQVQANSADNAADGGSNADDDALEEDVEFDELGGVITDKSKLKQIKAEKEKAKKRAAKSKRKAKKNSKKSKKHKSKSFKERRHHKDKKRKRQDDGSNDEEKSQTAGKHSRKFRDVEDGELSQSSSDRSSSSSSSGSGSSSSDADENDDSVPLFKAGGRFQDIAKQYPPSLRIIVQETNVQELTVGSLHLITYKGGTLGREGAHDVIIPDVNVSKCHLKFHYDTKRSVYKCNDMGSRNGTILNGSRLTDSKSASGEQDLVHGSVLQIGQTKLLCHVHEGNSTCGLCEPGLLIETREVRESATSNVKVLSHKEQLKKLQKKYGLENEKFVESKGTAPHNYNDRAATRRTKVGSSTDKEKTEVACVNTEIGSSNKGFKMLSKLGWQKGETLGKTNASAGLLTPINVVANEGTTGLGSEQVSATSSRPIDKRKLANLKITQARYQRANDIFDVSDESD